MKVSVEKESNLLKVFINNKLHIRLSLDKVIHLHSYKDTNDLNTPFKIDIYLIQSDNLLLNYSKKEHWEQILLILNQHIWVFSKYIKIFLKNIDLNTW